MVETNWSYDRGIWEVCPDRILLTTPRRGYSIRESLSFYVDREILDSQKEFAYMNEKDFLGPSVVVGERKGRLWKLPYGGCVDENDFSFLHSVPVLFDRENTPVEIPRKLLVITGSETGRGLELILQRARESLVHLEVPQLGSPFDAFGIMNTISIDIVSDKGRFDLCSLAPEGYTFFQQYLGDWDYKDFQFNCWRKHKLIKYLPLGNDFALLSLLHLLGHAHHDRLGDVVNAFWEAEDYTAYASQRALLERQCWDYALDKMRSLCEIGFPIEENLSEERILDEVKTHIYFMHQSDLEEECGRSFPEFTEGLPGTILLREDAIVLKNVVDFGDA